ncbi:hypothetical protein HEQ58_08850, partial [Haematospirillum jordaniae]|uniref:hypothetical protein n=1 Tax=Haematospirillum jordaniae TaxID=1549855 RepID=UPI001697D9E4
VAFLAVAFLATVLRAVVAFLAVAFLATVLRAVVAFLAVAFLATVLRAVVAFLAVAFLAAAFLVAAFLAVVEAAAFLAVVAFLVADFVTDLAEDVAFLAVAFLAVAFFLGAAFFFTGLAAVDVEKDEVLPEAEDLAGVPTGRDSGVVGRVKDEDKEPTGRTRGENGRPRGGVGFRPEAAPTEGAKARGAFGMGMEDGRGETLRAPLRDDAFREAGEDGLLVVMILLLLTGIADDKN